MLKFSMKTYYITKKPPSENELFATDWKTKRRYQSKKYSDWIAESLPEVLAKGKSGLDTADFAMTVYVPKKFRRANADLMNLEKATTDLLVKAGVIPDDRYIAQYSIRWADCDRVEVNVYPLQNIVMP